MVSYLFIECALLMHLNNRHFLLPSNNKENFSIPNVLLMDPFPFNRRIVLVLGVLYLHQSEQSTRPTYYTTIAIELEPTNIPFIVKNLKIKSSISFHWNSYIFWAYFLSSMRGLWVWPFFTPVQHHTVSNPFNTIKYQIKPMMQHTIRT